MDKSQCTASDQANQVTFSNLLKYYDTKEFQRYLVKQDVLPKPVNSRLKHLKTKREMIDLLNSQVMNGPESKKCCETLLRAIQHFVQEVHHKVTRVLNQTLLFEPPQPRFEPSLKYVMAISEENVPNNAAGENILVDDQKVCEESEFSSESSDNDHDLQAVEHSQEIPDDACDDNPDPGYFTQSKSLASCPSVSDLFQKTSRLNEGSKRKIPQTQVVHIHNHYYPGPVSEQASSNLLPYQQSYSQFQNSLLPMDSSHSPISGKISRFKQHLQRYDYELMESLDVPTLLPFLKRECLVTAVDCDALSNHTKTKADINRLLLSIIPSKGASAHERFVKCLEEAQEHSGHSYLVTLLK